MAVSGNDSADRDDTPFGVRPMLAGAGYKRLKRKVVLATAAVAVVPLVIMTLVNFNQYEQTLLSETMQSVNRLLSNNKRTLEFFLAERRSALGYIAREFGYSELKDPKVLGRIIRNMNESFAMGAFTDLGLIDASGNQICYKGPHDLAGRSYIEQDWFHQVRRRGIYTSDVFLGHRNSPHFAIAMRCDGPEDSYWILRATFEAGMLSQQIHTAGLSPDDDIFLINRQGTLQTPSRRYGAAMQRGSLRVPHASPGVEVQEIEDESGQPMLVGWAGISDSPFMLMLVKPFRHAFGDWHVSARIFGFLAVSVVLVIAVILWGTGQLLGRIREENLRRAALMHQVEYNSKLASIGRLAAGVAHEINNPLAIVNEKAGLLKDLLELRADFDKKEKYLGLIDSVLRSAERCKTVTHRLLGFARHMDVRNETIDVPSLLGEVVGFLGKEAEYRDIRIGIRSDDNVPVIESDRGQLQQVFLNLLNNAVSAVKDGGRIDIAVTSENPEWVSIEVADDGVGIPKESLQYIFEPFFTTKQGTGTGLGLSITCGIVKRLGGDVAVESEEGKGSCFTVRLPTRQRR
jgi:two-component system NtrC family sensor kinase